MDEYYNKIAKSYDELHEDEQLTKLEIVKEELKKQKIELGSDKKLLDIGCGTGISTRFWEYSGIDKTGIDPAEKLIEIAQKKDLNGQYFVEYAENIPFEDSFFDIIVSITSLQNFTDFKKSIEEIKRVAKKHIVLTFLKKAIQKDNITKTIKDNLEVLKELEEKKDLIFICKK